MGCDGIAATSDERMQQEVRKRATIAEVAKAAGVAASTVSRVINGGYASAEVRARVEKSIRELRYTPSPTARNLKMGRTGIVGVVVESSQGAWFNQLLGGIEERLVENHASVAVCSLKQHGRYDHTVVRSWVSERRVDALIFARAGRAERALVTAATRMEIPVAFIVPDETFKLGYTFRTLNRPAGEAVAGHLAELGHKNIAFAGGPKDSIDTQDRLQGLRDGLAAHGMTLPDELVRFGPDYTSASGMAYAEEWLSFTKSRAPTAVVLGNDSMALGFMRTVQQNDVRVPHDVSVVGFDGIPEGALWWPGLTTAEQRTREMGAAACESLLKRLEDPALGECVTHEFPTALRIRESTGPATR